jgi:adenylate kinase
MRLVFFGPPGSGKGTQAGLVAGLFGMAHLSTGSLFREEVQKGTELGIRIRAIMESGALITDDVVNEQVFSRISGITDFLLDGYPRNVGQAEALDSFLTDADRPLTGAVLLVIPDEEVIARLSGRLTCTGCGGITGADDLSGDGLCRECGGRLEVREDDRPEVVRDRLEHYRRQTLPLMDYYSGRMLEVDGVGTVRQVTDRIVESLSGWR